VSWRNILTVYLKELKDSLRDRRTVVSVVVIPTVVMPALMFGVGKIAVGVFSRARQEIPAVMIIGGGDSPGVVGRLKVFGKIRVLEPAADWRERISEKKIRAAVRIPDGFEAGLKAGETAPVVIYNYEGDFLVIMPAVVGMLPGIELNAGLALVPILNLSLVCREMLSGVWHWHYIALIFGSSCLYAAIALGLAVKMFNREDVIFRA